MDAASFYSTYYEASVRDVWKALKSKKAPDTCRTRLAETTRSRRVFDTLRKSRPAKGTGSKDCQPVRNCQPIAGPMLRAWNTNPRAIARCLVDSMDCASVRNCPDWHQPCRTGVREQRGKLAKGEPRMSLNRAVHRIAIVGTGVIGPANQPALHLAHGGAREMNTLIAGKSITGLSTFV